MSELNLDLLLNLAKKYNLPKKPVDPMDKEVFIIHPSMLYELESLRKDEENPSYNTMMLSTYYGMEVFEIDDAPIGQIQCMTKRDMYIHYADYFMRMAHLKAEQERERNKMIQKALTEEFVDDLFEQVRNQTILKYIHFETEIPDDIKSDNITVHIPKTEWPVIVDGVLHRHYVQDLITRLSTIIESSISSDNYHFVSPINDGRVPEIKSVSSQLQAIDLRRLLSHFVNSDMMYLLTVLGRRDSRPFNQLEADALSNVYNLTKEFNVSNLSWLMSSSTQLEICTLKDENQNYIIDQQHFYPSGIPQELFTIPILQNEFMDNIAKRKLPIVLGNWQQYVIYLSKDIVVKEQNAFVQFTFKVASRLLKPQEFVRLRMT